MAVMTQTNKSDMQDEVPGRYISRNQATVLVGKALYGYPRAISLSTLDELIRQGRITQVSTPSLGGKLRRHMVEATSVDRYVEELRKERGNGEQQ